MDAWGEFVKFVRGTRTPPPRGRASPLAMTLLVLATLAHLPLVYLLVRDSALAPPYAIFVGLVAMGLAWSGGVSLEGRRRGSAQIIAAVAIAEGALAFLPTLETALDAARWLFLLVAALAAGALWALRVGARTSSS